MNQDLRLDIINLLCERHILAGESWKVITALLGVILSFEEEDYAEIADEVIEILTTLEVRVYHVPSEEQVKSGISDIEEALSRIRKDIKKEESDGHGQED